MSYTVQSTGYVIPVSNKLLDDLIDYFGEDLENFITPGDYEPFDRIAYAQSAYADDDGLVGNCGVWYICASEPDEDIESTIAEITSEVEPADYYYNGFEIVLYE